ncbi:MAG: hypothetical protein MK095_04460 [Phycisphaerales bacterium]|nr:hypothetical protein [Phycisphaerales bacterium]
MRTRMFKGTLMLAAIGFVSGCSSTMTASQQSAPGQVSLAAMEQGQECTAAAAPSASLCLMACDDLGQEMWLWEIVLAEQARLQQLAQVD